MSATSITDAEGHDMKLLVIEGSELVAAIQALGSRIGQRVRRRSDPNVAFADANTPSPAYASSLEDPLALDPLTLDPLSPIATRPIGDPPHYTPPEGESSWKSRC